MKTKKNKKPSKADILEKAISSVLVESVYKPVFAKLQSEFEELHKYQNELRIEKAKISKFTDGLLTTCPVCGAYHTVHSFVDEQKFICGDCGSLLKWKLAKDIGKSHGNGLRTRYLLERIGE